MSDFHKIEERYRSDPAFFHMVRMIENVLHSVSLTPSEVRDAAMLACLKFEATQARTITFISPDTGTTWEEHWKPRWDGLGGFDK